MTQDQLQYVNVLSAIEWYEFRRIQSDCPELFKVVVRMKYEDIAYIKQQWYLLDTDDLRVP